jgi:hypothetical protein
MPPYTTQLAGTTSTGDKPMSKRHLYKATLQVNITFDAASEGLEDAIKEQLQSCIDFLEDKGLFTNELEDNVEVDHIERCTPSVSLTRSYND